MNVNVSDHTLDEGVNENTPPDNLTTVPGCVLTFFMSRNQAYERISMADFEASMQGIYSESVNDFTRDESPMVYKPAEEIIANISDTVTIDTIIRPIFNFKAS